MRNVQHRQVPGHGERLSIYQGLGQGHGGVTANGYRVSCWGDECPKMDCGDVNFIPETMCLSALMKQVSYISTKLLP